MAELTPAKKTMLQRGAQALSGHARRLFMAATVMIFFGKGGQRKAERELGWDRGTIRKGTHELKTGVECVDGRTMSGRKPVEEKLPKLLEDIKDIVQSQLQVDPRFETSRLYRRITIEEIRRQLIKQKRYKEDDLPCNETIRKRMNKLGFLPNKVQKTKPLKKIPETDEIFEWLDIVNEDADNSPDELRISMDEKGIVKIGPLSRGGKSRVPVEALDHDFEVENTLKPVGILLPEHDEVYLYFVDSKVTADCLVDILTRFWEENRDRFSGVKKLVINQDNGPECNSRRRQFMKRIVEFADKYGVDIRLAYYPPYHSKYNAIERVFGILELEWNGDLLDSVKAVLGHAASMTWNGIHPVVQVIKEIYETGKTLTDKAMKTVEERLQRWPGLEKYFVDIQCAQNSS